MDKSKSKINRLPLAMSKYKMYIYNFSNIVGEEFIDLLGVRDYIEREISAANKTTKEEIKALDKKFLELKAEILHKFGGLTEWPEYPESFWWRHFK